MTNVLSTRTAVRALPLIILCLLFVSNGEAQRRRSVRSPAAAVTGQCHSFDFVRPGLKATYVTTSPGGNANYTVIYIYDNSAQTKTTQVVTTSVGTSDVETIIDSEVFGPLRGIRHINVKGSHTVPVLGKVTIETDISFVPALTVGPVDGWCVGNTWSIPPVTETIVTKMPGAAPPPQIITTIGATGEVLAVGESMTVPAGTFQTVKYRGALVSGSSVETAIAWISMADNIVVRQDTVDASGTVKSTTTLMALQ